MIDLNITFLYQIAGFICLYFILNTFLYKPVTKILEERNRNIEGTKKEADSLEMEIQKKLSDYEKRLSDAKAQAQEVRLRLRQEGLDKEMAIVECAKNDLQTSVLETKTKLEKEIIAVMHGLKQESQTFSKEIAGKILGRKVA